VAKTEKIFSELWIHRLDNYHEARYNPQMQMLTVQLSANGEAALYELHDFLHEILDDLRGRNQQDERQANHK